jgi:CDP-diglyceride synthetase
METKIKALIFLAIIVILFLIIIRFKIKSDKKRKSLAISYAERERNNDIDKNETYGKTLMQKDKKPNLWGIPSWGLALLTYFLAYAVPYAVYGIISAVFKITEWNGIEFLFTSISVIIIVVCCFFICKNDPTSILYVPLLCNIFSLIVAIIMPTFWKGSLWIVICSGWVLSIFASILGARIGKRNVISKNY